jgi:hypothetical protein
MGLNLQATIGLNSTQFEHGLDRAKEKVFENVKTFAIAAIGVATFEEAIHKTIETVEDLVNSSSRLGITIEQVQLLRQAAKEAGKEMSTVESALVKINEARAKALGGDKTAMAAFAAFGVSHQDLMTRGAADLFMGSISETIKRVSPEQIAGPLREVLGRGGHDAVGILKTDFEQLGSEMKMISTETAAKLKVLKDQFDLIGQIIIAYLAPKLLAFGEFLAKTIYKGGGHIAGISAYAGSLVGTMNTSMTDEQRQREASNAVKEAREPWEKAFEELQKRLNDAVKNLTGNKADFGETANVATQMREPRSRVQADSLVRVGNFLGTNRAGITGASRMEMHASATARNTKLTVDALYALQRNLFRGEGAHLNPQQRAQQFMEIHKDQWPIN